MKTHQEEMTEARRANNDALTRKIDEVRAQVARIQMMGTGSSSGGSGANTRAAARRIRTLPPVPKQFLNLKVREIIQILEV